MFCVLIREINVKTQISAKSGSLRKTFHVGSNFNNMAQQHRTLTITPGRFATRMLLIGVK